MKGDSLLFGMKDDANVQLDPWELPPVFLLRHKSKSNKQNSLQTPSGYWKEKAEEFTAIRSDGESSSSSSTTPSYVGVRKTLEFHRRDGSKTDWIIHEYHNLRKDDDGEALFLEEDVVLRQVFKKGETDQASSLWRQVESCVRAFEEAYKKGQTNPLLERRRKMLMLFAILAASITYQVSGGSNEALGAHCHPDEKSDDDVWKHFTKIRTNDPDVVYAACHRCDKVLKAHSKKHGITQLKRHRRSTKCRSNRCNPSTDEDRQLLHCLRTVLDPYKQQKIDGKLKCQEVNAHLTQLNPCIVGHNPWYVTTSMNRQTNEGCWEEIDKEFTAIRMVQQQMQGCWRDIDKDISAIQMEHQLQMQVPVYMGLRRTLEFHLNQNGNKVKTGWIMLEYQQIDDIKSPALFLQGDMVIRKVFHYDKHAVASAFSDFNRWLNGDDDSEEYSKGEGVNTGNTTVPTDYKHGGGDRKRKRSAGSKRTSEVWMYFTEIHTADNDVVYAVCHHCDRGYGSGRSRNGTNHLWRHKKSCTSKLPGTGNVNNAANAAWEAEIWKLFLLFKNHAEQQGSAEAMSQEDGPAC